MSLSSIEKYIVEIPDFPKQGVLFKDITPLLSNQFSLVIDELAKLLTKNQWSDIDQLVGIESRGFILASGLASSLGKNLTLIRKKGKLPPPVISKKYNLEYGTEELEIKKGKGNILIIDDVLATGGTLYTSASLCEEAGYNIKGFLTLLNLKYLNNFSWKDTNLHSLIDYS